MTRVLAIETSTLISRVAILDDDRVLVERGEPASRHSEALLPLVDATTRECGMAPRDIELIAVSIGPGSFTGLRIGLATAKGLGFALSRPLVAVSSLAALAESGGQPGDRLAPVVDARRGDLYGAVYERIATAHGADLRTLVPDGLWTPAEFLHAIGVALGEDGAPLALGDALALVPGLPTAVSDGPCAAAVGRLALTRWRRSDGKLDELVTAAPAYLRLAAPEEKLLEKAAESRGSRGPGGV